MDDLVVFFSQANGTWERREDSELPVQKECKWIIIIKPTVSNLHDSANVRPQIFPMDSWGQGVCILGSFSLERVYLRSYMVYSFQNRMMQADLYFGSESIGWRHPFCL